MSIYKRLQVVVLDDGYESYTTEQSILAEIGATVILKPCHNDAAAVAAALVDADAALVRESPVTAAAIAGAQRCKAIVRYGVGVDGVDRVAAAGRKIYVANVPDYGAEEVSDHAMALLLAVARYVVRRDRDVRNGAWNVSCQEKMYRIAGRTLGLVGYGRIARTVERKMRGMGIGLVLVTDPYLNSGDKLADKLAVEPVDLKTLCMESDYISLHTPLTEETRHIIGKREIGLMKPTAILINTARGPLIDEAALIDALQRKAIAGAGMDVFEHEPLPADSPLIKLDNVVLSDHTAWYSEASVEELQSKAAKEVLRVLKGEKPLHWVNRWDD
jgi:D-3-phosphoglycerate dehydrogenase